MVYWALKIISLSLYLHISLSIIKLCLSYSHSVWLVVVVGGGGGAAAAAAAGVVAVVYFCVNTYPIIENTISASIAAREVATTVTLLLLTTGFKKNEKHYQ